METELDSTKQDRLNTNLEIEDKTHPAKQVKNRPNLANQMIRNRSRNYKRILWTFRGRERVKQTNTRTQSRSSQRTHRTSEFQKLKITGMCVQNW